MAESMKEIGTKALAFVVLLFAAYILLKVVIGVVSAVVWTLLGIVAIVAVVWSLNRIL